MTLLSLLDPSRGGTQTTVNCREQIGFHSLSPTPVDMKSRELDFFVK